MKYNFHAEVKDKKKRCKKKVEKVDISSTQGKPPAAQYEEEWSSDVLY